MSHASLALTVPLAVVLLLIALPAGVTGLQARAGKLDRRGRLGLQTPAARASDEAFSLANKVASPLTLSAAFVGVVCAILVLALPIGVAGAIVVALVGLLGELGQLGAATRLGERAARTVPVPARRQQGGGCCGGCGCGDGGCGAGSDASSLDADIPDLVADSALQRF